MVAIPEIHSSPAPATPTEGATAATLTAKPSWRARDIEWISMLPFIGIHLVALVTPAVSFSWGLLALALAGYIVRMFFITAGFHRYFSHRTFRMGRLTQFFFAFMAQTSLQRGALWWAAHHRHHHKRSDQEGDPHSPKREGFWYSQFLWVYHRNSETHYDRIKDFAKYPELVFLNRVWWLPGLVMAAVLFAAGGVDALLWGFFLSTAVLWHGTFVINSLTHQIGSRRFATTDDSRNHWLLAAVTLGEGWHNNHHHHMHACRQGLAKWEIDPTYMLLKGLEMLGLVWGIKEPPARVYREGGLPVPASARNA